MIYNRVQVPLSCCNEKACGKGGPILAYRQQNALCIFCRVEKVRSRFLQSFGCFDNGKISTSAINPYLCFFPLIGRKTFCETVIPWHVVADDIASKINNFTGSDAPQIFRLMCELNVRISPEYGYSKMDY